jgi:GNAT superfamily N-acetyltransferase
MDKIRCQILHDNGLDTHYIQEKIKADQAVICEHEAGFYIIDNINEIPILWFIFVNQPMRGKGFGGQILKEVMKTYGKKTLLLLRCNESLLGFYKTHGFIEISREGSQINMVGDFDD